MSNKRKLSSTEKRWALAYKIWPSIGYNMLGKYCFSISGIDDPIIKTFRTREEAYKAKNTCCYKPTKVIRVEVIVQAMEGEEP